MNEKLFNLKSKQGISSFIYNYVRPFTTGIKKDSSWENIHRLFESIRSLGVTLSYYVNNGGYSNDGKSKGCGNLNWNLIIV